MKDKGLGETSDSENGACGNSNKKMSPPRRLKSVDISDYKLFEEEQRSTQIIYSYKGGKKVPKLREPRSLFTFNEEKLGLQPPRWPAEMRVLKLRPRFIGYVPKNPEPFSKEEYCMNNGFTLWKTPDDAGKLVFDNPQGAEKYFMRSRVGGHSIPNKPFYTLDSPEDNTLIFESRFESGNLKRAIKVGQYDYQLWMKTDMYTIKHTQWFFFRVRNTQPGVTYQFTIMNFIKSSSLYNGGMQPLFYSEMDAFKKIGWVRKGSNVKYYKNEIKREDTSKDRYHYSLTWTFQFEHTNDTCYFAHCYPYTYSDLQEYLIGLRNDPIKTRLCKQRVLCRTLSGNSVYILTITNPSRRPSDAEQKRAVVVTARVHPGETNSSWMVKGLLDFLTSNSPDAKLLRDTFVFKIVPMINPDGVIVGNYRCSLTGRDLNRNYRTMLKDCFPPIWHIRNMIKKLLEERQILMYCDFHGHSRKQNVFIYGCDNRKNPLRRLRERIFPIMMSENAPCKFSYKGCKFKVQKSKEGTGRVVMWNMGIMNSYTMEATFCGSSLGKRNGFHFSTVDLEAMGYHLCDTLLDYCDPDDTKYITLLRELEEKFKAEILEKMKKRGTAAPNMTIADIDIDANYTSDMESSTGGSDSSVSDGLPMHLIYAPHVIQYHQNSKKKKLRSRKERNKRRAKAMKIKDVVLTDVPKVEPGAEVKLSYKKITSTSSARPKVDVMYRHAPRPHDHSVSCTTATPIRLCREHSLDNKGTDYLEAVTNAYMLMGVLGHDVKSDVPQFRYTAGSNYLNEVRDSSQKDSISRWSTHSAGAGHPSDEDGNFTVSYLAKHLERNTDCTVPISKSDHRVNSSAFDLARKITMCNSRYKMETSPTVPDTSTEVPVLRPASSAQPWKNHSWNQRSQFLSSTKAQLHHQPKQTSSGTDLTMANDSAIKSSQLMSTSGTWCENDVTPLMAKIKTRHSEEKQVIHRGRPESFKKQEVRMFDKEDKTKAMKKYTGNRDVTVAELAPTRIEVTKATSMPVTKATITEAPIPSGSLGRRSPVYVALPAERPPVPARPRCRVSGGSTPELGAKLIDPAEEPGTLISYALKSQLGNSSQAIDNVSVSNSDDDDSGPFVSKFSKIQNPSWTRKALMSNLVMAPDPSVISNSGERNQGVCRVHSPARRRTSLSPVSAGIIDIGMNHTEESASIFGEKKIHKRTGNSTLNEATSPSGATPSKISLTFKTGKSTASDAKPVSTSMRQGAFIPHFKYFYKNHR